MGYATPTVSAPDFPTNLDWLNSQTLTLEKLKGKVVLVDFWTYSCINCQRTLPYLKKWWDKYKDSGLVIIGVHTPEFDFEKELENVKKALKKYDVDWPVVLDNKNQIWDAFGNRYWPAKYLIDHHGKIIYNHFGEGNYIETEIQIQTALTEAGFKVNKQLVADSNLKSGALWKTQTPELYFGSLRGSVQKALVMGNLTPDQIYIAGDWEQKPQYLQHTRQTDDLDDLVILSYRAKEVFLVMESADKRLLKLYITLDGVGLTKDNAGKDVQFDKEGRSFVEVQFSTLYNLISTHTFGDHILRLSTLSKQLRLYAFTFGS